MSWLSCSSRPKARSTAGGSKSGAPFGGGGFKHTGGIGFDGGKLVISGLPEQTKQLFKEASKQKRAATGKGLTKRDVKHILKTYVSCLSVAASLSLPLCLCLSVIR